MRAYSIDSLHRDSSLFWQQFIYTNILSSNDGLDESNTTLVWRQIIDDDCAMVAVEYTITSCANFIFNSRWKWKFRKEMTIISFYFQNQIAF